MPKALISTITPISGGVPQMATFIADSLIERGYEPGFAFYQPYSLNPELSVPSHRLLSRRVETQQNQFHNCRAQAIGAWMPELEFTHYWPTKSWRELIDQYDVHLSVSGNCLAATPYAVNETPFWSWVATEWAEDREQRVNEFPWYRKIFDRLIVSKGVRKLEKNILASGGSIVALSEHTKRKLNRLMTKPKAIEVMPIGIDTGRFKKTEKLSARTPMIGFVGRLDDPRKNIDLLLRALALCKKNDLSLSATLVGEGRRQDLRRQAEAYGLGNAVTIVDYVENDKLPEFLSDISVFVIPSHQEGLCIAALEAMSCGIPVISTRCGGPEEYVVDEITGYLVDATPERLAEVIIKVITDSNLRSSMSENARHLVEKRYSVTYVKELFWSSFDQTFSHFTSHV
ncbi:glycosyltransferase family 4 protein [Pseudomonadota bacterium]